MAGKLDSEIFGPWNPGLKSDMPRQLLPLVTVFRPENVSTPLKEAEEFSEFCGLEPQELVAFLPERLAVHEILIRVSADLAIYDGRIYEDLGINFRRIAARILDHYVRPQFDEIESEFKACQVEISQTLRFELVGSVFPPSAQSRPPARSSFLKRFLKSEQAVGQSVSLSRQERLSSALADWERRSADQDDLEASCLRALHRIVGGIARKHGRLIGDIDLITRVAANLVSNDYGSRLIGRLIDPLVAKAVEQEQFHKLPVQDKPVVMNTKGASASGKSTMRRYQNELAERIGLAWEDFALISPDIWRKFLLDYDSLGQAYKYAGMMCGHEIEIVDRKLDAYMANKAQLGATPHLLIDRFRFDSFTPSADEPVRLLTRFGDLVYMFFMVTPPADTVERAWRRGQIVGRYKAVDDLLAHNIEAFSGMPELFFTWALRTDKRVHYEFLDNTVALGSRPRTIAFGWNGEMNVLDVGGLLNIDRFGKVNVRATDPAEVFGDHDLSPESNVEFIGRCAKLIPIINFADQISGRIYAGIRDGVWIVHDTSMLSEALREPETRAGLEAIGLPDRANWTDVGTERLDQDTANTIGAWGANAMTPMPGSFGR